MIIFRQETQVSKTMTTLYATMQRTCFNGDCGVIRCMVPPPKLPDRPPFLSFSQVDPGRCPMEPCGIILIVFGILLLLSLMAISAVIIYKRSQMKKQKQVANRDDNQELARRETTSSTNNLLNDNGNNSVRIPKTA